MLHRLDHRPGRLFGSRWSAAALWVGLVILTVLALSVGRMLPYQGAMLMFLVLGLVYAAVILKLQAARSWPVLQAHVSRESVERRLRELGA